MAPRSGLALRHHIDIGGGIIDEDYRGELSVIIFNHSDIPVAFSRSDRIAQPICQPVCYPALEVNELDVTERGDGGFGSTGD
jgi:dUTP pyrophosphatase